MYQLLPGSQAPQTCLCKSSRVVQDSLSFYFSAGLHTTPYHSCQVNSNKLLSFTRWVPQSTALHLCQASSASLFQLDQSSAHLHFFLSLLNPPTSNIRNSLIPQEKDISIIPPVRDLVTNVSKHVHSEKWCFWTLLMKLIVSRYSLGILFQTAGIEATKRIQVPFDGLLKWLGVGKLFKNCKQLIIFKILPQFLSVSVT